MRFSKYSMESSLAKECILFEYFNSMGVFFCHCFRHAAHVLLCEYLQTENKALKRGELPSPT